MPDSEHRCVQGVRIARSHAELQEDVDTLDEERRLNLQRAEAAEADVERLRAALTDLAGEYGCTLREPADPSEPPRGDACRDRRPGEPKTWCYACVASAALHPEEVS